MKPAVYCMSKIWFQPYWLELRNAGYNIISSWISIPCGSPDNKSNAKILTDKEKQQLWLRVVDETFRCQFGVIYAEKDDIHNGVLIETGHILPYKPVYLIGNCKNFTPSANSDCAYTLHPNFIRLKTDNHKVGMYLAVKHYLEEWLPKQKIIRNKVNDEIWKGKF